MYFEDSRLIDELFTFFSDAGASAAIDNVSWKRLREIVGPLTEGSGWRQHKPSPADVDEVKNVVQRMRHPISESRKQFVQVHGEDKTIAMDCVLQSLPAFVLETTIGANGLYDPRTDAKQLEERDRAMAEVIVRAANERFPSSKFVIMAAHAHLLRVSPERPGFGAAIPQMGEFLAREFGNKTYTISFEAYSGYVGQQGRSAH